MLSQINRIAHEFPNSLFSLNPKCTYLELERRIEAVSEQIQHLANQVLVVLASNTLNHVILALACLRTGVIYAPLNSSVSSLQLENIFSKYKFRNLYVDSSTTVQPPTGAKQIKINFDYCILCSAVYPVVNIDENKISNLIFTSGSTGTPKAVAHNLKAHIASALGSETNIPIKNSDRYLFTLPIFHIGGYAIIIKTIMAQSCIVFPSGSKELDRDILKFNITHLSLVPTQLFRLFEKGFTFKESQVSCLLLGGASIPRDLLTKCLEQNINPFISYGLSEMASQVCTKQITVSNISETDTGIILPYREVKISSEGEILVKGDTLFMGYYNGNTIDLNLDSDGFFHTRDRGELISLNGKNVLKVTGRLDNQFISGGENIQPEEIEKIMLTNPEINRCLIIGIPDKEWGSKVIALVETNLSKQQLYNFCKANLLRHQVPKNFYPISALNINFDFKIKRREIQQQLVLSIATIHEIS